jgi:hypothetical protein
MVLTQSAHPVNLTLRETLIQHDEHAARKVNGEKQTERCRHDAQGESDLLRIAKGHDLPPEAIFLRRAPEQIPNPPVRK